MYKSVMMSVFVLAVSSIPGCESCDETFPLSPSSVSTENRGDAANPIDEAKEIAGDILGVTSASEMALSTPSVIGGVELTTIQGWFANTYPWDYSPNETVLKITTEITKAHVRFPLSSFSLLLRISLMRNKLYARRGKKNNEKVAMCLIPI